MSSDPSKAALQRSDLCCWQEERNYWRGVSEGAAEDFERRNPMPPVPDEVLKQSPEERGF